MTIKKIATLSAIASLAVVTVSAQEVLEPGKFVFDFGVDFGAVGFRVPIEAKHVKSAPYSAEIVTESIQTLSDGNRIVQRSTARVYRDSEGRVRREEDRGSGSPTISITDPVAQVSFSLDSERRVAFQTPNMAAIRVTLEKRVLDLEKAKIALAPFEAKIIRAPIEAGRVREEAVAEQLAGRVIEGVWAEGVRRTTTIAAGTIGNELPITIVSEEWRSPDLQVLVMTERKDPRLGTSTYRVLNINRSEPAAYLFEVPSDYTVKQTETFKKTAPGPLGR